MSESPTLPGGRGDLSATKERKKGFWTTAWRGEKHTELGTTCLRFLRQHDPWNYSHPPGKTELEPIRTLFLHVFLIQKSYITIFKLDQKLVQVQHLNGGVHDSWLSSDSDVSTF